MGVDLELLHSVQLEILDFVSSVCEKNGLTWFLVYGTALGAYRHRGFIPWDDDVDVALPRDDYRKFLEIMKKSGEGTFELQDEDNEKHYFLSYAKVRKKNTFLVERLARDVYTHNGIFIDVFPLDFIRNVKTPGFQIKFLCIRYLVHILKFDTCRQLYKNRETKRNYLLDSLASSPARLFSRRALLKILNWLKAGYTPRNQAVCVAEYDSRKMVLPYFFYFPPKKILFEGRLCNVPNEIEEYLAFVYGNTFLMPPQEQFQESNKILEVRV